nr:MAG TPA: hypothetical protein [Caudoviricetes sp.]
MDNPSTGLGIACDHARIKGMYWVRFPHKY